MLVLNIIALVVILILSFRKEISEEILEEEEILKNSNSLQAEVIVDKDNRSKFKHLTEDSTSVLNKLNDGLGPTLPEHQHVSNDSHLKDKDVEEHKSIEKSQISIINPTNIKNEFNNVLENPNFHKILVV